MATAFRGVSATDQLEVGTASLSLGNGNSDNTFWNARIIRYIKDLEVRPWVWELIWTSSKISIDSRGVFSQVSATEAMWNAKTGYNKGSCRCQW